MDSRNPEMRAFWWGPRITLPSLSPWLWLASAILSLWSPFTSSYPASSPRPQSTQDSPFGCSHLPKVDLTIFSQWGFFLMLSHLQNSCLFLLLTDPPQQRSWQAVLCIKNSYEVHVPAYVVFLASGIQFVTLQLPLANDLRCLSSRNWTAKV